MLMSRASSVFLRIPSSTSYLLHLTSNLPSSSTNHPPLILFSHILFLHLHPFSPFRIYHLPSPSMLHLSSSHVIIIIVIVRFVWLLLSHVSVLRTAAGSILRARAPNMRSSQHPRATLR